VLATKYTTLRRPGDPNSGGSHRKNLFASVEASLRQLNTDYLDLLYLHVWDFTTPVEEILRGMDDLVRQGKVLYVAISNAPAWQVSRMQTIAGLRAVAPYLPVSTRRPAASTAARPTPSRVPWGFRSVPRYGRSG